MLPASNKGVGMNMGFPDVCLTPAVPAPVPIPYPNMAMNAMAAPFCPTIFFTCMPALNMGSIIPMTLGMQPGVANPLYMQMGMYTMGNPVVLAMALPAITLTCPTTGNAMNNPVGAVLVPSVTNVFLSDAESPALAEAVDGDVVDALAETLRTRPVASKLVGDVGYLRIERFLAATPSSTHHAIADLRSRGATRLVIDLRGCPGGETDAAIALAGDFLEERAIIATIVDVDGDGLIYRSSGALHREPLTLLVDGGTASAAELFAGALRAHARAAIVGARTYGKSTAQAIVAVDGRMEYRTVGRFLLPDVGDIRDVKGIGIEPDRAATLSFAPGDFDPAAIAAIAS
jgi:carboxyl-terminal processing protease